MVLVQYDIVSNFSLNGKEMKRESDLRCSSFLAFVAPLALRLVNKQVCGVFEVQLDLLDYLLRLDTCLYRFSVP